MEVSPAFDPWLPNHDLLKVFDWQTVFGNSNPVEVDLGAGDGGFSLEYAKRHPEINLVATERLLGRVKKIAKRAARENVPNIRAIRIESHYFIHCMCAPASVSKIHIMFPDPWPKRKHFKYRLIQPEFIAAAQGALLCDGEVRFSTDHEEYFNWAKKIWDAQSAWEQTPVWDYTDDPLTDFQQAFAIEGRPTHRARWKLKQ